MKGAEMARAAALIVTDGYDSRLYHCERFPRRDAIQKQRPTVRVAILLSREAPEPYGPVNREQHHFQILALPDQGRYLQRMTLVTSMGSSGGAMIRASGRRAGS
jgi:hypothetical protein